MYIFAWNFFLLKHQNQIQLNNKFNSITSLECVRMPGSMQTSDDMKVNEETWPGQMSSVHSAWGDKDMDSYGMIYRISSSPKLTL